MQIIMLKQNLVKGFNSNKTKGLIILGKNL